jgi:hypothetical protein
MTAPTVVSADTGKVVCHLVSVDALGDTVFRRMIKPRVGSPRRTRTLP